MEEAVKQITALVSTGSDWPYALVWLNGDACHVPLHREGYLSTLVEGGTSSATCRKVSQVEVCQLLSLISQVIYPVGLNRCEVPMIASPPKSLAKGTNLLGGKSILLKNGHPTIHCRGAKTQSAAPWQSLLFHPDCKPCQGFSAKGGRRGQHDHGSEGAPIPGGIRHVWTHIREFHSKDTRAHGPGHTSAHQTGGFPLASRHIIPGECPRWQWDGGMPPWSKSLLPPLPQLRHQGPAVVPLPQMQPISGKRPTRPWENC